MTLSLSPNQAIPNGWKKEIYPHNTELPLMMHTYTTRPTLQLFQAMCNNLHHLMEGWRILWRPFRYALALNIREVQLAMVLHNYCIDHSDSTTPDMMTESGYTRVKVYVQKLLISNGGVTTLYQGNSERNALLKIIQEQGIRHPHVG